MARSAAHGLGTQCLFDSTGSRRRSPCDCQADALDTQSRATNRTRPRRVLWTRVAQADYRPLTQIAVQEQKSSLSGIDEQILRIARRSALQAPLNHSGRLRGEQVALRICNEKTLRIIIARTRTPGCSPKTFSSLVSGSHRSSFRHCRACRQESEAEARLVPSALECMKAAYSWRRSSHVSVR